MARNVLYVRITAEQEKILKAKCASLGFKQMADYVRHILFTPLDSETMIKQIHKKVIGR